MFPDRPPPQAKTFSGHGRAVGRLVVRVGLRFLFRVGLHHGTLVHAEVFLHVLAGDRGVFGEVEFGELGRGVVGIVGHGGNRNLRTHKVKARPGTASLEGSGESNSTMKKSVLFAALGILTAGCFASCCNQNCPSDQKPAAVSRK